MDVEEVEQHLASQCMLDEAYGKGPDSSKLHN